MILLIEGYKYKADDVKEVLEGLGLLENLNQEVVVNYVGYMYNPHIKDCVFILPKVLTDEREKAFGHIDPTDLIHLDKAESLTEEERRFIYEFAVWIYRALYVFKNSNPENDIIYHKQMTKVGNHHRHMTNTFLEVLLALVDFNKKNQNFFMMVLRNLHSGNNKINWTKTISSSQAFVQDGKEPIYLNPINKKRQINFDEELLVIFFSILNYIKGRYGFPVQINMGYELIIGEQFNHYLNGYGLIRLRQIKYKYFSDKTLYLWELCYAFFERSHQIAITSELQEYLVAKNFNIVFEAIIDELVGDKELPDGLKDQPDGKIVDHLYSYKSLTTTGDENKDVFYIGDSKYYKLGNEIGSESVYKQFTYARNVIQWNMNLFLDGKDNNWSKRVSKYRDEVTEGYNIVPNFFISARMDKELSYDDKIYETQKDNKFFIQRHFENRLFDRDTLLIYHYDVNFLYIVSLYAQNDDGAKHIWKDKVRALFRKEIQKMLADRYDFYAMQAHQNVNAEEYLKNNFQQTLGKIYKPFKNDGVFSLALDKTDPEGNNEELLRELRKHFFVVKNEIGKDPEPELTKIVEKEGEKYSGSDDESLVLVGCIRNKDQYDWAIRNGKYNIRVDIGDGRNGAVVPNADFFKVKYLLLYSENKTAIVNTYYTIHEGNDAMQYAGFDRMKELFYPFNVSKGTPAVKDVLIEKEYKNRFYLLYGFNNERKAFPENKQIDLARLLSDYLNDNEPIGKPFIIKMADLLEYLH
ncbi:MAG: restriction endonuclease [Bacteroidaceae bacterium]|nr:restriction endonuclease [Bacteroidaceae bacterium]